MGGDLTSSDSDDSIPDGTCGGDVDKIIAQKKRKKRKAQKPPPPEPLAGDLTSSDSDNCIQDGAWGGNVDNNIIILHQLEDKESGESDVGWDLQAGMPMTPR